MTKNNFWISRYSHHGFLHLLSVLTSFLFVCGCTAKKKSNDETRETTSFEAISEMNKLSGADLLDLSKAYGPTAAKLELMNQVRAVSLGDFVGGKDFARFAGYKTLSRSIALDIISMKPVISEDHVGMYGGGAIAPKFALVFSDGSLNEIVLMACLSITDDREKSVNDFDRWVVMETSSGMNAPVDSIAGKILSDIRDRLDLEGKK